MNPERVPTAILQIIDKLDQQGFETWLVGGCVRDLCLGLMPKDFDLATNALPEQVMQQFERNFATGLQHGTVTVLWQDLAVEITTFRSEGTYTDSRRPDLVVFHDQIDKDLARRDFTMNSMAWRPDRGLLDLHGGLDDLRRGVLRCVGDPQGRFEEDALRLLRAVRFAVTYNLRPESTLIQAAARLADRLGRLSRERLTAEMLRILGAPYPERLAEFAGSGLLALTAALLLDVTCDDCMLCERLIGLIRPELTRDERLPMLLLAAAAPAMTAQGLSEGLAVYFSASTGHQLQHLLMARSRVSRNMAQAGEALLYLVCLRLLLPLDPLPGEVGQRRLLRLLARRCHLPAEAVWPVVASADRLLALCLAGRERQAQQDSLADGGFFHPRPADRQPLTVADLALDGRDLQALGYRAGPLLRLRLERLLSRVIAEPAVNQPDRLADLAKPALHHEPRGLSG